MRVPVLLASVGALTLASQASAFVYLFDFPIDGLQEVPPVATPGTGNGVVTYDDFTNMLSWTITYQDLIGQATLSHFHGPAGFGMNAGVQIDIAALSGGIASPMVGMTTISESQEADLLAGLWYVNIHSTFRPGGEIRGQVVPAPGALALGAFAGLAAVRRRR